MVDDMGIDPHRLYTVKQAAGVMGYSVRHFRRLMQNGKIEVVSVPSATGDSRLPRIRGHAMLDVIEDASTP